MAGVALGLAAQGAHAQAPSVADLVDNNRAFLKLDKAGWNDNAYFGKAFNMHFIAPLLINGTYWTYYIGDVGGRMGIKLAKSTDGIKFDTPQSVLGVGATGAFDSNYASFPGVWYENGTFYLVYEGAGDGSKGFNGDIGLATSTDGVNFTKQGVILWHNKSGWESVNIGTPSLYKENGVWYLHYHGYDGNTCQIGVASGTDLMHLTKASANPIIKSIPGTAQAGTAGRRGIVKNGSRYYMVYEVSEAKPAGAGGFEGVKWSSSMASSSDLINWTGFSQNNVLPQTVKADGFGNDGPTFMGVGGANYIYYRVSGNSPHTRRALIANENYGGFDTAWTMSSPNIGHMVGRVDGDGWSANMSQDTPQYLQYGPYYAALPAGDHIATWSLMIDNNTSNDEAIMRLEVVDVDDNYSVISQRDITRKQWKQTGRYEYFSVPFRTDATKLNHRLELRAYWYGRAFIREGRVGLS
jgi:hypothetical protein